MNDQYDEHLANGQDEHGVIHGIARQLQAAAVEVPLRPGSELATVRTAHRRRHRRRNVTAAAAVVAVTGGTTIGLQQLAQPTEPIGTAGEPVTPGTVVGPGPAPTSIDVPATTTPYDPYSAMVDEIAGQIVPAVAVESNYVWNVVTPESANAVYGRFDGSIPGVIVSTAPGRAATDGVPERALYYTDDGIDYDRLDVAPPSGLLRSVVSSGDRIYNVGTAPGIAETDANPIVVEYSADRGATWQSVELPVDTHDERELPMLHEGWGVTAMPIDNGVLAIVQHQTSLDYRELPAALSMHNGYNQDGLRVIDGECGPDPTVVVSATVPPGVAVSSPPADAFSDGECSERTVPWDEVGVPPESVAALFDHTTRIFRVVDGVITEVPLPDGVDMMHSVGSGGQLIGYSFGLEGWGSEQQVGTFVATANGELAVLPESDAGPACCGVTRYASATHEFVEVTDNDQRRIIAATSDGTNWTYADTSPLRDEHTLSSLVIAGASDDALVSGVMVRRDLIAEQGGISIDVDGVIVEKPSSNGEIRALDAATGELLAERVAIAESPGDDGTVAVLQNAADGTVLGEITYAQLDALHGGDVYDESPRWFVESTADGIHVASESVAELIGVSDDEVSSIGRITTVGRQVIVAVTMKATNPDGTFVQKVLVGTPET